MNTQPDATAAPDVRPVGIVGVGAAAPSLRLAAKEPAAAWGSGGGRGSVAVCDADEDTLTLAWRAATSAMEAAGVRAADVAGLWWGTSRPPFAEGPSHAFLSTALGCSAQVGGALCSGSPHAGMEALLGAWDAVASGHVALALVVCSDALLPGIGTAGEASTGAGALAVVLSGPGHNGAAAPARLVGRVTTAMAVVDRYRGDAEAATGDAYDGRLFREEVFLPLLARAGKALAKPAGWSVSDPDGKLGGALAKALGAPLVSTNAYAAVGDTGAAAALLGAGQALGQPGTLGIIGYGGGRATAVAVEVTRPVPGAENVAGALAGGQAVGYVAALRSRGQLVAQSDPIPMGVPPGSAAFVRGNLEMLALLGARCRACATVSTPPSIHPTCTGCGGSDLEIVSLARRGTVQTFVVNQTMPPPFQAPLPLVVVDLDDGARLMVQGTSADAAELAIGDTVVLGLRRYAVERGVPVYGYKAFRVAPATGDDAADSDVATMTSTRKVAP
ncbi:MAG TPA: OB-fold domain-containing protein [Acidimicrobiales bacterium]|nr:OB-fold domain-containing protein [Acidimicrobiales bacterium]